VKYAFTGDGDSPDLTLDANGNVVERTIGLVGGVLLTVRGSSEVWSYPNIHGDTAATADANGVKQGPTLTYDPYGQALNGVPDNSAGNFDYGWLGTAQRPTEGVGGTGTIEMGARPYVPGLGRFLRVDPVDGGSANDDDYVSGDPLNAFDLNGTCKAKKSGGLWRHVRNLRCSGSRRVRAGGRWLYRHTELSGSFYAIRCYGVGFQGGTLYTQSGWGCCFVGVNVGVSRRSYEQRSCNTFGVTGEVADLGAYGEMGVYKPEEDAIAKRRPGRRMERRSRRRNIRDDKPRHPRATDMLEQRRFSGSVVRGRFHNAFPWGSITISTKECILRSGIGRRISIEREDTQLVVLERVRLPLSARTVVRFIDQKGVERRQKFVPLRTNGVRDSLREAAWPIEETPMG
jgi:RHS repeat-associated protein